MNKRPVDKNATEQIASRRKGFNMASTFQAMDKGTEFIFAEKQAVRYIKTSETTYESVSLQMQYSLKLGRENANVFLKDPEPQTSANNAESKTTKKEQKKHQDPDILNLHCPECDKEMVFVGMGFTEYWCEACGTSYDIKTKEFEDQGRHKKDPLANSHGVYMRTEDVIVPFKKNSGYTAKIAIATTSKGEFVMATSQRKTYGDISGSSSDPSIYDKRYSTRDEALMAGAREILERIKRNLKARDGMCTEATNKAKMTSALADIENYISKIKPAADLAKSKPTMPPGKKTAIKVPEIITLPQKGLFDHLLSSDIKETKTTMLDKKKASNKKALPAKTRYQLPGWERCAGTTQKIINKFPPHTRYAELCLGSGKILNAKKPAAENYGVEINESTIAKFTYPADATIINQDAITWIKENWNILTPETLVYVDPPYPMESRRSQLPLYDFEMTDQQHIDLLELLLSMPAMVAISTYKNDLYAQMLKGWTVYTFESNTRQGLATEYLYMNYPDPVELHEYTYLGKDFTDRQRIKRKVDSHVKKLRALPPLERKAIIQALKSI